MVDIAEKFGAKIDISGPDPDAVGYFFVKREAAVDHDQFMQGVLRFLGDPDRLAFHHRSGFAIVLLPYGRAQRLKRFPHVAQVGGVQFDPEQFAAMTGMNPTEE